MKNKISEHWKNESFDQPNSFHNMATSVWLICLSQGRGKKPQKSELLRVSASFCLKIYRPKIVVKDYFRERIDTVILKWMFPTASYYIFRRNVFVLFCYFNESNLNGLIIFQISNDLYFDRCSSWPKISNPSTQSERRQSFLCQQK